MFTLLRSIAVKSIRLVGKIGVVVALAFSMSSLAFAQGMTSIPISISKPLLASIAQAHVASQLSAIDINQGFAKLVKTVKPAVVNISTTTQNATAQKLTAVGSGFIIAAEGLVVTNYHVIKDAEKIEVVFDDSLRYPATLKGYDKKTDLALLKINSDEPLPFVIFGDSDVAQVGDWVIAIGNPFGLGGTTTKGIISARGRDIQAGPLDDFLQIDAPINRGNSGGPLFNTKGEVIGVNSAIFSPNGGNVGIGFAIPASMASNVIAQLRDSGVVRRGFLGVQIQSVDEEISDTLGMKKAAGALVTQVVPGGAAEKSGIEAGDVILAYNGKKIRKVRDLTKLVALTKDKTAVDVQIWRNEKRKTVRVVVDNKAEARTIASADTDTNADNLGLAVSALDDQSRAKYGIEENANGVVIVDIDPNSNAAKKGLREGDVIKRVGSNNINSPDEMNDALKAFQDAEKKSVLLLVERDKQTRFVVVPMNA